MSIILFQFPNVKGQNIDSLVTVYKQKATHYLVKSSYVNNYFRIDRTGVSIFASPYQKQKNNPEFAVSWSDLAHFKKLIKYADRDFQFKTYKSKGRFPFNSEVTSIINIYERNATYLPVSSNKPLTGVRIAIDPGHIAGDLKMAKAESRFIDMTVKGEKVAFFEGELTLTVALMLRDSLIKQGAEVFLSRDKGNLSAIGKTFDQWITSDLRKILKSKGLTKAQIDYKIRNTSKGRFYQKYFLDRDLDARAEKINYFKPHFTIVIHFNADSKNIGWKKPTHRNYSMTFVPGAYLKYEMSTKLERFDFVRTLLTEHMQESTRLSSYVMDEFERKLDVPRVSRLEEPNYLKYLSKKVKEGIYARNLRLCRLLNTPICYGESLLQDNEKELLALSKNDFRKGIIAPRLINVTNAYYVGIMRYVIDRKKQMLANW